MALPQLSARVEKLLARDASCLAGVFARLVDATPTACTLDAARIDAGRRTVTVDGLVVRLMDPETSEFVAEALAKRAKLEERMTRPGGEEA